MSDLRDAAELALTALEWNYGTDLENIENCMAWLEKMNATIPALRQALAQPEQKTPLKVLNLTVFTENRLRNGRVYDVETLQAMTNRDILAIPDVGKKALAEVLEALNVHAVNTSQKRVDETAKGEHEPLVWMNKYGHVASFKNEELGYTDSLYTIPVEYKAEIERLHREIENLRQAYHRVKDENERLALDLGIKNKDFYDQR